MAKKAETIEKNSEEITKETMTGDIRDILLDILRNHTKSWGELTEDEQRTLAADVQERCEYVVAKAVNLLAADGRPVIEGHLESVTVKDGFKAVITMSKEHALRHSLVDAQGFAVLVVVTDADQYKGEKAPVEIDPNQRALPVDDTGPVADKGRATAKNA